MRLPEGFVENMPFEEYAAVPAMNFSSLKHMMRSPLKYKWFLDHPEAATAAMVLGNATHKMILEPERVNNFAVWGEEDDQKVRRGKVWEAFQEAHASKEIITASERDAMVGIAVSVRRHLAARKYLTAAGPTEVSMFWEMDGRRFKGRIDKLIPAMHTTVNLKTTVSSEPHRFGGQAFKLGYYMHEALYWEGYKILTGAVPRQKIIAFESRAPYEGAVYRLTPDVRLQGLEDLHGLLDRLAHCEKTNTWPAEMEEESDLILPSYAMASGDEDLAELAIDTEE
jgi:hypothetical protein